MASNFHIYNYKTKGSLHLWNEILWNWLVTAYLLKK